MESRPPTAESRPSAAARKPEGCCRRMIKAHAHAHKRDDVGSIRRNANPFVIGNLWWIAVQACYVVLSFSYETTWALENPDAICVVEMILAVLMWLNGVYYVIFLWEGGFGPDYLVIQSDWTNAVGQFFYILSAALCWTTGAEGAEDFSGDRIATRAAIAFNCTAAVILLASSSFAMFSWAAGFSRGGHLPGALRKPFNYLRDAEFWSFAPFLCRLRRRNRQPIGRHCKLLRAGARLSGPQRGREHHLHRGRLCLPLVEHSGDQDGGAAL
jgi:hypothetical protein